MNANELIEAYVTEVAVRLPRKQRNDVAFELRELLREELQAKADDAGRDVDSAMATELLQGFGRPADVAARYRPTLTIIDPEDGHTFLRATVIGLAVIWGMGLLTRVGRPIESVSDVLMVLGQWWGTTVIASLWWPGLLVVSFGLTSWARRRRPQAEWKPRTPDHGSRALMVLGLVGILFGLFVLINPSWILDMFFGGRAAPAAYEALTYTETFRQRQAPYLLALIMLSIPVLISKIVGGRWADIVRRNEIALNLAMCAVMMWTVLDGPILNTSISDRTAKSFMVLIVVATLIDIAVKLYRSVRPAPKLGSA